MPRLRLRLAFLEEAKWRRPGLRRNNLPVAVTLNRLATAFLVFRRAMDLGMGRWTVVIYVERATPFFVLGVNFSKRTRMIPEDARDWFIQRRLERGTLKKLCSLWSSHFEFRNSRKDSVPRVRDSKEGTFCCAVRPDDMVAIIGELVPRGKCWEFPNNAVTFDYHAIAEGICDDPLPTFYCDGSVRFIENCDEIDKREWAFGGGVQMRDINNPIDHNAQSF